MTNKAFVLYLASEQQLVLMDLTGDYGSRSCQRVHDYNVHRAQGRKVKQFIPSYGQKTKTDKINAKMLTT
jgi:transposase